MTLVQVWPMSSKSTRRKQVYTGANAEKRSINAGGRKRCALLYG